MGLWKQLSRFFTPGADDAKLEAVQRLLIEADFGVAATTSISPRSSVSSSSSSARRRRRSHGPTNRRPSC